LIAALVALPLSPVWGNVLQLPDGAVAVATQTQPVELYRLPLSGWKDGALETLSVEGNVTRQAWQIPTTFQTALEILSPLKKQLADAGYDVLFECETQACGGFDFRYSTDVLPEPDMHVNLGDFHFVATRLRTEVGEEYLSLLVSRTSTKGYAQIIQVSPPNSDTPKVASAAPQKPSTMPLSFQNEMSMDQQLLRVGRAVLDDLEFQVGSSNLTDGAYASLDDLAAFLREDPARRVVLVGHTDAEGSLENNLALSRKRAASVRARLVDELDVPAGQIDAQGVGYLAPLASNQTNEGRTKNRRVEVILTSTQ